LFTRAFRTILADSGVDSVRLPSRSPNLNAYAERFVRSVRDDCLSKVIPLGEKHLRELLREYGAHYHGERNHQGIANALIDSEPAMASRQRKAFSRSFWCGRYDVRWSVWCWA
jgi:transposase InsO family protein